MDDIEIDPAIAEAMGFSSFGGTKRRKFNHDEATIDPDITKPQPSGANTAPLGSRSNIEHGVGLPKRPEHPSYQDPSLSMPAQTYQQGFDLPKRPPKPEEWPPTQHVPQMVEKSTENQIAETNSPTTAFPTGVPKGFFDKLTWKELEQFRKGVKNENGDVAYFLPSFIEDPWAKLEREAEGSGT
ncbi:hypothetical protein E2P81_ATG11376 [Venturia nashicola]|uniref:Uncharacterized protein n=1 Tax=Venturia nashicola TaxID=86259 RepID=A0A4Z1PGU8_9PEZI|nr:hypothetical protein E6O75_ATG11064 [Venturia nashicola]TLD35257.1 hypothetical protein E2P81_ATG11376 [Venturia nashicola]